jgi:hydroxyquinol 1,2-dioxygenase
MRNFNETSITDAVVDSIAGAPNPRVRAVSTALVRHLHNFVREIEPTEAEWVFAIDFLTRAGQMCSATRQEFILLSDALGVSMLVDAINHRFSDGATESTVLGPFHVEQAPDVQAGAVISQPEDGPPLLIEGSVKDTAGNPIEAAVVDIWHADDAGFYDVQKDAAALSSRARIRTDAHGNFHVIGAVPAPYPIPNDGPVGQMLAAQKRHPYRPAHVHFMIAAPGMQTLVTHLFLHGSDYLDSDVVFGVKDSLIESLQTAGRGLTAYGALVETPMQVLRRDFVLSAAG